MMNATSSQPSLLDAFLSSVKKFDPYPMLYSRTSTGSVQTWKVEIEGDKYRFHTGKKGGAIITTEWTTCKGKSIGRANETTPEEQAAKEAKAAMADKLKSGGYWESESDIDRRRFFPPMLAHKYVELDDNNKIVSRRKIDWAKGVWASPKMDGLRCVINREGAFSREGNQFLAFPHIPRELQALFIEDPNLILDGECYTHALANNFNKIISLAKKKKPTPAQLQESEDKLEYWVFDVASHKGTYTERYAWLEKNIQERFKGNKWINLCEHVMIYSEADMDAYLSKCIQQGFEGAMMNIPDTLYEPDRRSYFILKYKLFMDEDFEIIDVQEGDGNRAGMMGRCVMKIPKGGTFDCDSKGNAAFFRQLLRDKKNVIGKKAIVRFQNYTPDGKPRFCKIIAIRDYE